MSDSTKGHDVNTPDRRISIEIGFPWFTAWLFTVAFAHLSWGPALAALIAWPYYLGDAIAAAAGVR